MTERATAWPCAEVRLRAPAKVNLRLKIEGRRADGYHLLSMLNAKICLWDEIVATPQDGGRIELDVQANHEGSLLPGRAAENLVVRALRAFQAEFGLELGCRIVLRKQIPVGAGLGGGSSDAAAMLRWLGETFKGHCGGAGYWERVNRIASGLGADVPFFMGSTLAWVRGIGERLLSIDSGPIEGREILICLPAARVETKNVFEACRKRTGMMEASKDLRMAEWVQNETLHNWEGLLLIVDNDLEAVSSELVPELAAMLAFLRKQTNFVASMTGSGTAAFALFRGSPKEEAQAFAGLSQVLIDCGYRVWHTHFADSGKPG